jgi:ATP-dependent exoDNAse (exonuclease V) alpha subunit
VLSRPNSEKRSLRGTRASRGFSNESTIHGIGFKTADQIAQKIGIPHDSILRACAGLNHVLLEATGQGHCALPVELLRDEAGKLLLVDEKIVTQALERTLACGDLIQENIAGQELLFLPSLKRAEEVIAARIRKLCALPANYPPIDVDKAVEWCQRMTGKELAPAIRDIQVLCPMNRGSLGIRELNVRLQTELNPARADEPVMEKFGWQFRVRDKVIQTENDYDKDVFNGDIGQIVKIDLVEREVTVRFDQCEIVYDFGELDEVALAYAITIHKSQGSEFPVVVTPLAMQQYLLLQRNLVYTGITRGKKLVVLIGQRKALGMAVRNNRTERRFSGLLARLLVPS